MALKLNIPGHTRIIHQKTQGAGAAGYGLLMSVFGVGSLLALTHISQLWSRNKRQGLSIEMIFIMSGLLLAPLVFLRTFPLAMIFMGLAGFAAAPYSVVEQSLM